MKIAVCGYVSAQEGSVASANALLLRSLLNAGHAVDFFSKPSFVDPRPCVGEHERFRFISTDNVAPDRFRAKVQHLPVLGFLACRFDCATYTRLLLKTIRHEHRSRRYDLCLWLGDYAPGRIPNLPAVSFAQGPPGTDARSIVSRFAEIKRLAGLGKAAQWLALARLRLSSLGLPQLKHSDHIIVGSRQSQQTLHEIYGIPGDHISTLPYPIDLAMFQPAATPRGKSSELRLLWLGRIIPRKRLDLFLGGLECAIRRGLHVKATIVGGTGFVPGYDKLIDAFPFPDRLRWIKNLPRKEVPELLRQHDVLAQPSDEENFGSSVAEAQACGLPVIVGHTNGNADYLCERDIHLADDQPETFADALAQIAATTSATSAASHAVAEKHFDLARVTTQLTNILHRMQPQASVPTMESIDIIIPTLKRPDDLRRCLQAVKAQDLPATNIWIGVRADDDLTPVVIAEFASSLPVNAVEARGVGVVGSMNSCLAQCRADHIALLDDDVEIPPHWLRSMLNHIRSRGDLVAAGGRDMLMDYPEMRQSEPLVQDVGNIHWFGRVTGGHHRGGGTARCVQVLRGSNCLFKGDFLRRCGFEAGLRGKGAQVNWELALGLQARSQNLRMIFDPTVRIIHNVAPRHDGDTVHRGIFNFEGTSDIAYNETFVALKHGRGLVRWMIPLWQFAIGSHVCPGLLRAVDFILRPNSMPRQRFAATWAGRMAALRFCLGYKHEGDALPKSAITASAR
ncbi:MAG: glycosyltransferase [Prosthecobacter sp.]|jgi:glycosyltransferase involved in cell wall biosynthesis|uniref:glycosyltransferase n=1 Tax=Prosthecobacter sp. TaxID=1965333 RepID=UPI001A0FADEF|nr:glycosyltransferase [Prosthecobacter sp.]MBE2286294.1 glycosyltransferase [Prosthecobacter sp.]